MYLDLHSSRDLVLIDTRVKAVSITRNEAPVLPCIVCSIRTSRLQAFPTFVTARKLAHLRNTGLS